jgi:hypothetical protein
MLMPCKNINYNQKTGLLGIIKTENSLEYKI